MQTVPFRPQQFPEGVAFWKADADAVGPQFFDRGAAQILWLADSHGAQSLGRTA